MSPSRAKGAEPSDLSPIDIDAIGRTDACHAPFPHLIVPHFIRREAFSRIEADFPKIEHNGSFPLTTLNYGPSFAELMAAIERPQFRAAMEQKLDVELAGRPTMTTVRGICVPKDGRIHSDSRTKIVTVLIYMNGKWENPNGRLRLLRSPTDLDDVVAEVPPDEGTLLAFRNDRNAWHGFESFAGRRRVIQLNWVNDSNVVWREQTRHRVSAFFKRLYAPA
ncbi:MAG: 2OG-Fe(II) oxygenase [Rhizomicrobium sp.]